MMTPPPDLFRPRADDDNDDDDDDDDDDDGDGSFRSESAIA